VPPGGLLNILKEMSPEDRESMRRATVDVKAAIKDDFIATDEEIQESLWYYYFDVDKTVNYLRGMYISYTRTICSPLIEVSRKAEAKADKAKVCTETQS
jgi:elongation factor 1 alpha-like protein